jgi:ankyrin repeat protein
MTPLMRAAQRNNYTCAQFLLNETASELNGSLFSTYTPLWFGVSNGYTELVKLLLDYNANPSINDQHKKKNESQQANNSFDRTDQQQRRDSENSSFLFSPIRASIVYSQFHIMRYVIHKTVGLTELSLE